MKEKFFTKYFVNGVLAILVASVFVLCFSLQITAAFSSADSPKAYYNGDTSKARVSLMFNVYGGSEYIEGILQTLQKHDVKATFFIGGIWAEKNENTLKQIFDAGHELGNHGYLHKDHKKLSRIRNQEEILITQKLVQSITGTTTNLFAPPSGSYSKTTLEVADELGYKTIMWSADTIDWRDQDEDLLFNRVSKKLNNGTLVLMHPTKATMNVLDRMISHILEQNYEIVVVSENIS